MQTWTQTWNIGHIGATFAQAPAAGIGGNGYRKVFEAMDRGHQAFLSPIQLIEEEYTFISASKCQKDCQVNMQPFYDS